MTVSEDFVVDALPEVEVQHIDPVLLRLRREAGCIIRQEPYLVGMISKAIIKHKSFESMLAFNISQRLGCLAFPANLIKRGFLEAFKDDASLSKAVRVDALAVLERDPACTRLIEPVLYFKGYHAIVTHRLAHWLWYKGRQDFALGLQSRSSEVFQTDIHPAAHFGLGIFLDHATGIVVGATTVVGDNVSILQGVTLGGTGKTRGDRHPKIGNGVLIGAGANVLGNIEIGNCARIAAGSVVLHSVADRTTVAGVPAKVIAYTDRPEPGRSMDQSM